MKYFKMKYILDNKYQGKRILLICPSNNVYPYTIKEVLEPYKVNTELTIALVQKEKTDGVGQFIFMSSAIVYGDSALGYHGGYTTLLRKFLRG